MSDAARAQALVDAIRAEIAAMDARGERVPFEHDSPQGQIARTVEALAITAVEVERTEPSIFTFPPHPVDGYAVTAVAPGPTGNVEALSLLGVTIIEDARMPPGVAALVSETDAVVLDLNDAALASAIAAKGAAFVDAVNAADAPTPSAAPTHEGEKP